jgi:DNA-binding PadR family transcriptional regulator
MKGIYLGEFEEMVLLIVGILYDQAYGLAISKEIARQTERAVHLSAVHSALHRLEKKGFLSSRLAEATQERGGKRKRLFTLTAAGSKALRAALICATSCMDRSPRSPGRRCLVKRPDPGPPAPPAWVLRFLEWYCNPGLLEEIQGDLNEAFYERVALKGLTRARLLFIVDVLRFIRPFTLRRDPPRRTPSHLTDMLSNYSKIAWRNLAKNKVYSAINIAGLSIGLACCLTIGLYIWDELSYDRFHPHAAHLYRVVEKQNQAGTLYNIAVTPGPLAPALKTEFAAIRHTCRLGRARGVVQLGKVTAESDNVLVADNSFFHLFGFKLLRGNPRKALLGPGETVISEAMAERLFGAGWRGSQRRAGPAAYVQRRTDPHRGGRSRKPAGQLAHPVRNAAVGPLRRNGPRKGHRL